MNVDSYTLSLFPEGSKKDVFRFRSVKSMVIAPANTGRERSNKIAVIRIDHAKSMGFYLKKYFYGVYLKL